MAALKTIHPSVYNILAFVADRIINSKLPITYTLTKNIPLFLTNLKEGFKLSPFNAQIIYVSLVSQEADLEQFFAVENQLIQPSLS